MLREILSNTYNLCRYRQWKTIDVICSSRNTDMTLQTVGQCRSEESFNSGRQILLAMGLKTKSLISCLFFLWSITVFFTHIEAVRYILISKICFCLLMVQIADHNYHYFRCFIFLQDLKVFFNSVGVISVTVFG